MGEPLSNSIHVSAPGKLMLLGEHAVVHGHPCLVTAMEARLHMRLGPVDGDTLVIQAPDVGVDEVRGKVSRALVDGTALARGTRFIESAIKEFREEFGLEHGLMIQTRSDFSSQFGLGSSSATVACTLFGLAKLSGVEIEAKRLFSIGKRAILRVQKTGSGYDLAAAIFGGTLYYCLGERDVQIEPLNVAQLPLVVAYSGIKADTATYIGRVHQRLDAWPGLAHELFDSMHRIVINGRSAIEHGEWGALGELMDMQHGLLHALGVDTAETARLVFAARAAGAYGAKLSGAGGGDCMIALTADEQRGAVEAALEAAGGQILTIHSNAQGVRVETEGIF